MYWQINIVIDSTDGELEILETSIHEVGAQGLNLRGCFKCGGLLIDTISGFVTKENRNIPLTAREWELLLCLIRHKGEIVSNRVIAREVLGSPCYHRSLISRYIGSIRRKVGDSGFIINHHGRGYQLVV